MSIVRFGTEGSNVYVYVNRADEFVCCCCGLRPDMEDYMTKEIEKLVEHLKKHRSVGHIVPDYVFEELLERGGRTYEH